MNRALPLFRTALLLINVFQLGSCKKIIDTYFPGHGSGNEKVEDYRIKKLVFNYRSAPGGDSTTAIVYYNQHNNPDSVVFDELIQGNSSQARHVSFVYNNENKLKQVYYLRFFAGGYHSYGYDSTGRISTDTSRFAESGAYEYYITYLGYDNQNRIISEEIDVYETGGWTYYDDPIHYSIVYQYDANGNRIRSRKIWTEEPVVYDNKVNYLRTNEIWMFISRNYSRNNANAVSSYNDFGLPLGFRNGIENAFLTWGDPYEIEYEKID